MRAGQRTGSISHRPHTKAGSWFAGRPGTGHHHVFYDGPKRRRINIFICHLTDIRAWFNSMPVAARPGGGGRYPRGTGKSDRLSAKAQRKARRVSTENFLVPGSATVKGGR